MTKPKIDDMTLCACGCKKWRHNKLPLSPCNGCNKCTLFIPKRLALREYLAKKKQEFLENSERLDDGKNQ